jgi:histidinol-phosphate aminotransferase
MPPSAARVLRDAPASAFARYPDPYSAPLKAAVAAYCGVEATNVVTGCGSDDVLDSAVRAFALPGERLATCDPTFVMVPAVAIMNGLECARVPFAPDSSADADALLGTRPRIIYVCSPNNPTGGTTPVEMVARLADESPGLVIVDEAYIEFTDSPGCVELARTLSNVLVVRTMSKAFGLAGLRVGFGIGSPEVVREVEKSRGPFKVGAHASLAAQAALREDVDWMRAHARLARETRATLAESLARRGIVTLPSSANFLLAMVANAAAVAGRMRELGVAVRPFTALRDIGDALRITVGPGDEMQQALAALDTARQELACA